MPRAKKSTIPPLTAGGTDNAEVTQSEAPAEAPAPAKPVKAAQTEISVVALEKGTYAGIRRKVGDKFTLKARTIIVNGKPEIYTAEKQFSESWMKKI